MNAVAGLAGQLELAARLQRDRRPAPLEGDHVLTFQTGNPAEAIGQPAQHGFDAPRSIVARGAAGLAIDADLFVLGADPPLGARLGAPLEVRDQRIAPAHRRLERGAGLHEIGHSLPIQRGYRCCQSRD